jgi:DNA segregation ATPase FtsK/SpoIIIE-like protein
MASDPLEILLAGYRSWYHIGNDVLIAGLIAEVAAIAILSEHWKHKWAVELLAGVVVLVGVWIEVRYGGYADDLEHHMRQVSNEKIAGLNRQANQLATEAEMARRNIADANARAKEADARGRLAGVRIAELKKEAEDERRQIAIAEERANEANARIAIANEKAEAERLARVKLEKAVSWRELTDEQRQQIAVALRPFAGEQLDLFAYRDEPDAWLLASQIGVAVSGNMQPRNPGNSNLKMVFRRETLVERMEAGSWLVRFRSGTRGRMATEDVQRC